MAVHQRHLKLVFEVADGAQPAHDELRGVPSREVDREPVEGGDLDVRSEVRDRLFNLGHALVDAEEGCLPRVVEHADHQPIEKRGCPSRHVQVGVGHRIERAGKDGDAAHGSSTR